ncbi:MAG: DUF4367 domain-containing protein [Ruminococcus sp.]|nr:DUF4367 domain-containing protein [Ruminococcus sp.]
MSESNLEKALYNALVPEYETAMQDIVDEHKFSPKFERKMKKLINRRNKPYYKIINTSGKRVACVAVTVLIVSSVTILNVDALRNMFSDFFVNTYEKSSKVQPVEDDSAPITLEEIYEITYNISDFEIDYFEENKYSRDIVYVKDDIAIYFTQYTKEMYHPSINTEDAEILTMDINGHEAIYFVDNNNYYNLIWDNGDYIISLGSNIGKNTLIDMAKSVQKVE